MMRNRHFKPRNASFTLEERLDLLKILKPKIKIVDSHITDNSVSETKKDAWESIQKQFVELYPDRHGATPKDIRELWRRLKHRARMEVRQKVQAAKRGGIRTLSEEHMGWMPDKNHTVVDINDLGLEEDTKAITDFVPLLEEEATVLETRNGVLHGVAENGSPVLGIVDTAAATVSTPSLRARGSRPDFDFVEITEVIDEDVTCVSPEPHVKVEPMEPPMEPDYQHASHPNVSMNSEPDPVFRPSSLNHQLPASSRSSPLSPPTTRSDMLPMVEGVFVPPMPTITTTSREQEIVELKIKLLNEQHQAKMALTSLKQEAASAKLEAARAKRSAYDEKRMFYFDKRKKLQLETGNL